MGILNMRSLMFMSSQYENTTEYFIDVNYVTKHSLSKENTSIKQKAILQ